MSLDVGPGLFWIALGLLSGIVVLILLPALTRASRGPAERRDYDLAVYRDQLEELDRDLARGVLTETQAASARTEIERRMLRAADAPPEPAASRKLSMPAAAAMALAVPLAALLGYLATGHPELPDMPLSVRTDVPSPAERVRQREFADLTARLASRLEQDPSDIRGWRMLARAYRMLDRAGDSAAALGRAVEQSGGREATHPELLAEYAEALVIAADGEVTPTAQDLFRAVLAREPNEPRSRHFLAVARGQAGDLRGALALWRGLAADAPEGAPWLPGLRERIGQVAAQLGVAVESVPPARPDDMAAPVTAPVPAARAPLPPGPTREDMAAAAEMSAEERAGFIRGMVERLAARLEAEPDDAAGWLRLGRAYTVLGEIPNARRALNEALARLPADSPDRPLAAAQLEALGAAD